MNVYLYQSGTEKPLKNAYIGEVVYKYLDLRGKTLAQVQAEGFDITSWNGSYTLDSSGLHTVSSSNNGVQLYFQLPKALTSSNRITINLNGSGTRTNSSYGSVLTCDLAPNYATDGGTLFGIVNTGTAGGITGISYGSYSTSLGTDGPHTTGGDFNMTMAVDLSNGDVSYTLTGAMSHTTTATLNSTQLTQVLSNQYVGFRCCIYNNTNTAILKTVEVTVS